MLKISNGLISFKVKIIMHQDERTVSLYIQFCHSIRLWPKKTLNIPSRLFVTHAEQSFVLERYHGFIIAQFVHKLFVTYISY